MNIPDKTCPSCGEDIPSIASVCKHCFHDFTDQPPKRRNGGLLAMLVSFAGMAVIGAGVLGYVVSIPLEERILVDEDTRSVVWTRKYRTGISTDRLAWDQIVALEYVIKVNGDFEITAVTPTGERHVIHEDKSPLKSEADKYSKLMDKPLKEVDETHGFHKID